MLGQPYLRAMASLKAPLWREKPNSSRGREVSQLEAPFSCARSMARWRGAEMVALSVVAELFAHLQFYLWAALLAWIWASRHWKGYSASWLRMRSFRGADTSTEARYSVFGRSVGLTIPRPPSLTGNARSSRSESFGGGLPVKAGISRWRMQSSRSCSRGLMYGIVLDRKENLCTKPWVKAV